jgi:hypothetical protein
MAISERRNAMLDFHEVNEMLSGLTLLRYYPAEDGARLALAELVAHMATTKEQIHWLVQRVLSLHNEWPGPLVLRQIFCSRFPPRDGLDIFSTAEFPDGIPVEQIEQPAPLQLPDGHVASIDPELERAVRELAAAKDLNGLRTRHVHPVPVDTNAVPITEQDIENAVEKNRQAQALSEFKGDVQ